MKIQRLTALDVFYLAEELNNELQRPMIRNIASRQNDLFIETEKLILSYSLIAGAPFIISADKLPAGRHWLNAIEGGIIENVSQVEKDRLLKFEIAVFDRLGKKKNYNLYLEFYKNGNIILTNSENRILSSLRRSESGGDIYISSKPEATNILNILASETLSDDILEDIKRLNILPWSGILESSPADLNKLKKQIRNCPAPHIIKDADGRVVGFSVYGPPFADSLQVEKTASILEAVTGYVTNLESEQKLRVPDYRKRLKKAEKKLEALRAELEEAQKFRQFRECGELILANLHSLKKGLAECRLPGARYDGTIVTIQLNPALTPSRNAKEYFDKARKAEGALRIIKKRIAEQTAETARLKELEGQIVEAGLPDLAAAQKQRSKTGKLTFRLYKLEGGWQVYVGKSAMSNDELTFSFARKDDLWFHAWQASGSHLILRAPQKGMVADKETLEIAASLAAYFSKAKGSGKVPVIYTEVRHLRKVKKVAGKVIYAKEKELMIEPKSPNKLLKQRYDK